MDIALAGFYLKKAISFFLMPLGIVILLLVVTLVLLLCKRVRMAILSLVSAILLLTLFSWPPVADTLLSGVEYRVTPPDSVKPEYIHILGAGASEDESIPALSRLNESGLKRLMAGYFLHLEFPDAKIVLTGYEDGSGHSYPELERRILLSLGVDESLLIVNGECRDTEDEALFDRKIIADKPFLLVTSAYHMRRSLDTMKMAGLSPIPAPADFKGFGVEDPFHAPEVGALLVSSIALHEYWGRLWVALKSLISKL
jgi:uncharacterized SAM-binding protein YcdF (DUF218 family)